MTKNPVEQLTSEFEINDAPLSARNLLTRGHIQDEITQMSGCAVTTRGRYMTPVERLKNTNERALYLYIQGPSKVSLDIAIQKIDEIIRTEQMNSNSNNPNTGNNAGPMKQYRNNNYVTSVEKVYVGIENVSAGFDLRGKLIGVRGTNLNYIRNETGAIVTLRGKGSLFIDPQLGTESSEPLHLYIEHSKYEGLTVAKQLALNLIETLQQEVAQSQPQVVIQPQTQLQIYSQPNQMYAPQTGQGGIRVAPPPQLNIPPPGVHIPSQQGPLITQNPPITLLNTGDNLGAGNNMIITNQGGQLMTTASNQSQMIYNHNNGNPYQTLQFQIPTSTAQSAALRPQFNNGAGGGLFDQQQSHAGDQQHGGYQQQNTQQNNQLITQLIPTQQMIQGVPQQQQHQHQQTMQIIGNNGAGQPSTMVTVPMHSQFQLQQPGTTTTQLQVNPQTVQLQQINTTMIPTSSQVAFQIPIQQQNGGQYLQQQQVLLQPHPNGTQQIQLQTNPQMQQIPILPHQQQIQGGAAPQYMTATTGATQTGTTQQGHQIYATQQGLVLLQQNQNLQTVQQQSISNYTATIQQQQSQETMPQVVSNAAQQQQIQMNLQPPALGQQATSINCIQSQQTQHMEKTSDQLILEQMVQQQQQHPANHLEQRCVVSQQQSMGGGAGLIHNPTTQLTLTTATSDQANPGNNQLQLLQQPQQHIICDPTAGQQDLQGSTVQQTQHNSIQFINQSIQQLQPTTDLQNKNLQQSYLFMQQPAIQTSTADNGAGGNAQEHQITFIHSAPAHPGGGQQLQLQSQPFTSTSFPISIQQITQPTTTMVTTGPGQSQELVIDNTTSLTLHSIVQPPDNSHLVPTSLAATSSVMPQDQMPQVAGKKRKLSETELLGGDVKNSTSPSTELSGAVKKSGVGIDQTQTGKAVVQTTSTNNYSQQKGLPSASNTCPTSTAGNQKMTDKEKPPQDIYQRTAASGNPPQLWQKSQMMPQEKWQQWMPTTQAMPNTPESQVRQSMANNRAQQIPPQVQQIRPNFNPKYQHQYLSGNQQAYNKPPAPPNQQAQRMQHYNNQMNMQQVAPARTSPYLGQNAPGGGQVPNQHYMQQGGMNSRGQAQGGGNWPQQQNSQFNPTQSGWM